MDKTEKNKLQNDFNLFKTVVQNMAEGICLTRVSDALIVYANPKFEKMFGYDPGELAGKPVEILNAREGGKSPQEVSRQIAAQVKPTGQGTYEVLNRKKDGTDFWCRAQTSLFDHEEYGKVWISIHEDIDERKKLEDELRRSEMKFRSIFENSMEAVFLTAPDGRIFSANPAACAMTGYSEEELIRLGREAVVSPLEARLPEFLEERRKTGRFRGNLLHWRKDGVTFPAEISSTIFKDREGEERTVVIARDITKKLQAEQTLRESEVRFRELFENAPLGCFSLDEEGRLIDVNQAWLDLLGYTRDQVVGKRFGGFLAPQEEEAFRKGFPHVLTGGEVRLDLEMVRRDGSRIFVHVDGKIGHDEHRRLKQYHYILHDITQNRQSEMNMLDYQKQLQSLTKRLSEVGETERKKMAQSLHDLVGQNLTALQLNLDIILGQVKKDQNRPLAARLEASQKLIEETTQRIREVISDLRPSVLDDFGLTAALYWYGDRFQEMTGIQTQVEGKDFSVRLPPFWETIVYRIAQEALTNVLKHASAGRVSIRLRKFKNKFQMTIMDNGKGFRFDEICSEAAPKGWGLTTMREQALGLGGDLQVYSEPGKGTRVVLQVPTKS